ncbi:hypothetical protein BDR04DRAFT_571224 [Suillus decipiens]|nr:hypothetical protein BDR04DRAFT_571224 [Suillus decipiens]
MWDSQSALTMLRLCIHGALICQQTYEGITEHAKKPCTLPTSPAVLKWQNEYWRVRYNIGHPQSMLAHAVKFYLL